MKRRQIIIDGDIARVPLTRGYEAIIDADDVPLVAGWNWCALVSRRTDGSVYTVYAKRLSPMQGGKKRMILMHRVLLGAPDDLEVDHRDIDGLNNRRTNLRPATRAENNCNKRTPINNTSGVKGVTWNKASGKWRAKIALNGRHRHLGMFSAITEAAAARASATADLHGEFARNE